MAATGASRSFFRHTRSYLHSPFTPLLFFVPLGLVSAHQGSGAVNPLFVFLLNGLGIIPLANLISSSVEEISEHLGDQWGGCLNATFGNLVELVVELYMVVHYNKNIDFLFDLIHIDFFSFYQKLNLGHLQLLLRMLINPLLLEL